MIRHSLLAGFATLALMTAPAMAQNFASVNNTAAGIGNKAIQGATVVQKGGGLFGGPNIATVGNTAAGIKNKAQQGAVVLQGSPGLFSGPNIFNAQNLAAGVGNYAGQKVLGVQR